MDQVGIVYEAAGSSQANAWAFILPLLLLAAFWLIAIRPGRKRQREMAMTQQRLRPGARVMTTAGLFATVETVEDDAVVLEAAPGVRLRYARQAVVRVLDEPPAEEDTAEEDEKEDAEEDTVEEPVVETASDEAAPTAAAGEDRPTDGERTDAERTDAERSSESR